MSQDDGIARLGAPELSGVRVLVVDDDADLREVIALLLEWLGAEVATAANACDALEIVRRGALDVVVSDLAMPGEDGFWLIDAIRQLPTRASELPVAALTASASEETRERVEQAGFDAYLAKPMRPAALAEAVLKLAVSRQPVVKQVALRLV